MASVPAPTSYKKKDGILDYNSAKKSVLWTPSAGGGPVSIPIASITNLKQTPAASDKVALRIEAGESVFQFGFTSGSTARAEQEAITDVIRREIQARSTAPASTLTSAGGTPAHGGAASDGDGHSAAMAIAHAVRSGDNSGNSWSDDKRLMTNIDLQQSLFERDPELRQRFEQSLRDKPDSISHAQFGAQFWSARINLLRAHAIEKSQTQGAYNVLAALKETNQDGTRKLNLTKEHIQALFKQHPIVKHIYNEVVPNKLSESEFWTRFFVSRLLLKLKGERIRDTHSTDAILDKYLTASEPELRNRQAAPIPHFIDLEGNEQNHSQKQGNRPHYSMIPEFGGKAPLLGVLNNMSERMMANVAPNDGPAHAPIGMDEDTYNQLRLHDLAPQEPEKHVILDLNSQQRLFGGDAERKSDKSAIAARYAQRDPGAVLSAVRQNISRKVVLGADFPHGKAANDAAVAQIIDLLGQQSALASATASTSNLSDATLQSLHLTHSTSMEFLSYFWSVLLAPGGAKNEQLASLHATLQKSVERIRAVASAAESERQGQLDEARKAAAEYQRKTGKKRKVDESGVTIGGREEVESIMAPTLKAIKVAGEKFTAAASRV